MEKSDFIKRIEDLDSRCERTSSVTCTGFLTPAEQYELEQWKTHLNSKVFLCGGGNDNERKIAFFLPFYLEKTDLNPGEYIDAVKIKSFFGQPEHRDYMGAVLGLGIKREWIGDFIVSDDTCYVFCTGSVKKILINELEKVGRCGVKVAECTLSDVPSPEKAFKTVTFTVKSLRLDAVAGDIFKISRNLACEAISQGLVSLNYSICLKKDAEVRENDVLSLRGKGKGRITEIGGKSKKDRLFITAEIYK